MSKTTSRKAAELRLFLTDVLWDNRSPMDATDLGDRMEQIKEIVQYVYPRTETDR